jgi:Flp pilus assembly protein TadD
VTESRQLVVLLEQAEVQRRLGNHRGATDLARRALTLDPDHARGHAVLAGILLDARRLAGAGIEIRSALALDGNDAYIHRIAAQVLTAERKLDDAWAHALIAMQDDAVVPSAYVVAARVRVLEGAAGEARELLLEALALDAGHTDALTELARLAHTGGKPDEAATWIAQALDSDPADHQTHVVAGHIDLARGDAASAEQHARFVMQQDANDTSALKLWAATQARRSWLLGAWWRLNSWVLLGGERRRLALLIGGFVVSRIAIIVTEELDLDRLSRGLSLLWLGFCVYTWFAPVLFRRMVARSLKVVQLDPEF